MDALPLASQGPDLTTVRASEIGAILANSLRLITNITLERQKWFSDPRDLHASSPLHQLPLVSGAETFWDHNGYRYEWRRNNQPVARPLSSGGLVFNEKTRWWERNDNSWQPEKKTQGGRQTVVNLQHLGVVVQPLASRMIDKAKMLLRAKAALRNDIGQSEETLRGVPTLIAEVLHPEISAKAKIDLEAKSHVLYSPQSPFRLTEKFNRKNCRHPSMCSLHPHTNVDVPQNIRVPLVEEPDKLEANESGFLLRSCQQKGHEHLSHDQDPCFSDAKEEGRELQFQENVLEQVLSLSATGVEAEELERIWQGEEERERQQEILMAFHSRQENRPVSVSVSAQMLFQNAAKSLQNMSQVIPDETKLCGGQRKSFPSRAAPSLKLRGGSGRKGRPPGQPLSWKVRDWFSMTRREPVHVNRVGSDLDESSRGTSSRKVRHRVSDGQEFGFDEAQWARRETLDFDHDRSRPRGRNKSRPNQDQHDQVGELELVGTLTKEQRQFLDRYIASRPNQRGPLFRTWEDFLDLFSRSRSVHSDSIEIEIENEVEIHRLRRATPHEAATFRHHRDPTLDWNFDVHQFIHVGFVGSGNEQQHSSRTQREAQLGHLDGPPRPDDPRTQAEVEAWRRGGREIYEGMANVVSRSPERSSSRDRGYNVVGRWFDDRGYDIEEREPRLRGGAGQRICYDKDPSGFSLSLRSLLTGTTLEGESHSPPPRRGRSRRRESSPYPLRRSVSPRSPERSAAPISHSRSLSPSIPHHVDDYSPTWHTSHQELPDYVMEDRPLPDELLGQERLRRCRRHPSTSDCYFTWVGRRGNLREPSTLRNIGDCLRKLRH